MKKSLILIVTLLLVLLSSCGKDEEQKPIVTADMLNITNYEMNFPGAMSRYDSVMSALTTRITVLKDEHNKTVKQDNPSNYFLSKDYILSAFSPIEIKYYRIISQFSDELTSSDAENLFRADADGATVIYTSAENEYLLKFIHEEYIETFNVSYDKESDSFRYLYLSDKEGDGDGDESEFLEFVTLSDNSFAVQTDRGRITADFDSDGKLREMYCSKLKTKTYTAEKNGIYGKALSGLGKSWTYSKKRKNYEYVYEYSDNILILKDYSAATPAEIKIDASKFESAFYLL